MVSLRSTAYSATMIALILVLVLVMVIPRSDAKVGPDTSQSHAPFVLSSGIQG